MTRNRSREAVREQEPAEQLRADLRQIAGDWADLQDAILGGTGGANVGPITGTPERGTGGNWAAIQISRDVTAAAWFLARVIADETSSTPPNPTRDLPAALHWIATWRADWLAHHPDLGEDLPTEWRRHAARVHGHVTAERVRVIHVGVPCPEHVTSDLGERIPCAGRLTVTLDPDADGLVPDLVCDQDGEHRISPEEWFRAARRGGYQPDRIGQLLAERRA